MFAIESQWKKLTRPNIPTYAWILVSRFLPLTFNGKHLFWRFSGVGFCHWLSMANWQNRKPPKYVFAIESQWQKLKGQNIPPWVLAIAFQWQTDKWRHFSFSIVSQWQMEQTIKKSWFGVPFKKDYKHRSLKSKLQSSKKSKLQKSKLQSAYRLSLRLSNTLDR